MKRLTFFEYRKLTQQKIFVALLILLLILNCILTADRIDKRKVDAEANLSAFIAEYMENPQYWDTYMANYEKSYRLAMQSKDGDFPPNVYSDNDFSLFQSFDKIKNYNQSYQSMIENAKHIAAGRILEYEYLGFHKNSFEMRYQQSILDSYRPLQNLNFPLDNIIGYDIFFSYSGFAMLLLFGIGLLGIQIVTEEKNASMAMIIKTTRYGRHHTMLIKLLTGFSMTAVLCVLFTASTLITLFFSIGLHGRNIPIQMIASMQFCPFAITVGEGVLLTLAMQIFTAFVFFVIVVFLTVLIRNMLGSFAMVFVFIGGNFAIANYTFLNEYSFFKNMNLFWALDGMKLISTWRGVKAFGTAIGTVPLWLMVYGGIAVLASVGAVFLYANSKSASKKRVRISLKIPTVLCKNKKKRYPKNLFCFELKKVLSLVSCFIMIAGVLLTGYLSDREYHLERDFNMNYYSDCMNQLEGPWTEEKHQKIETEYRAYAKLVGEREQKAEEYKAGLITQEAYGKYLSNSMDAEVRLPTLKRIMERSTYLKTKSAEGQDVAFFDDTGWNQLQTGNLSFVICTVILIVFSDVFAMEKRSGFDKIQRAAKRGRAPVILSKFAVCISVSVILGLLSEGIQIGAVSMFSGLDGGTYPAYSMQIDSTLSVAGYFALQTFKNIVLYTALGVGTSAVSMGIKRMIPTLIGMATFVFAPMIFSYFGVTVFDQYSFVNLFMR